MYSIGYDIGSSSIKASLIRRDTGEQISVVSYPDTEIAISAPEEGWAEQNPALWWEAICHATHRILQYTSIDPRQIQSVGI